VHQIIEPLPGFGFHANGRKGVKYDADDTGYGWKTDVCIEAKDNILPTTCRMERP